MKVLVVEDAKEVAQLIALVLRGHVSQVTLRVDQFHDVIDDTDWSNIDVVISDRLLADYDGCNILAALESDHPHIGRILLTADATVPFDECHAHLVLPKPISIDRLTAAIETVRDVRSQ